MSGPRDPFEKQMEQSLAALAPRPGPQLADRTMDRIARTSQRSTRLTRMKHGWARRPLVAVLIGATILVAVAAGNSVLHLLPDHGQASGSRMLSASPPAASPSNGVTPGPRSRAGPIAAWERIDVPDPIVNMLGQAAPSDVVPYGTGYFAMGSFEATCVTDVAQGPAGCAEAIGRLFRTAQPLPRLSGPPRTGEGGASCPGSRRSRAPAWSGWRRTALGLS